MHTNGNKTEAHIVTYKSTLYIGGMVADYPKLAGDGNPHISQNHIRIPNR